MSTQHGNSVGVGFGYSYFVLNIDYFEFFFFFKNTDKREKKESLFNQGCVIFLLLIYFFPFIRSYPSTIQDHF